jgi:hypothetical protein
MSQGSESVSADEAFWLLGEETRLGILRAVWEADGEAVTFSEIRNRVGNPDSGAFNYHLDKVREVFLIQTDEGYELSQAGREVVRAVMAGVLTKQPELPAESIDGRCPHCSGGLVAEYDRFGVVKCGDCGEVLMWNEFPPAGLSGRSVPEFARAFDRWTQHRFRLAMDEVCPNCASGMHVERSVEKDDHDEVNVSIASMYRCRTCKYEARVPLFGHAIGHPAVITFFFESGLDVTTLPYWRLREMAESFSERVVAEDPWEAEVTVAYGGRELVVRVNEAFDVVNVSDQ